MSEKKYKETSIFVVLLINDAVKPRFSRADTVAVEEISIVVGISV